MLQRDYISRLIREFMAALQRYLEKNEAGARRKTAEDLFRQYFGSYEFYHTATHDEIMSSFEKYPEEERISRMEMLAELYYAEADDRPERSGRSSSTWPSACSGLSTPTAAPSPSTDRTR